MAEHRPRASCPKCRRDVAISSVAGLVAHHNDRSTGARCEGSGKVPPDRGQLVSFDDIVRLIENLDTYIERRAQQIADDRLKELGRHD